MHFRILLVTHISEQVKYPPSIYLFQRLSLPSAPASLNVAFIHCKWFMYNMNVMCLYGTFGIHASMYASEQRGLNMRKYFNSQCTKHFPRTGYTNRPCNSFSTNNQWKSVLKIIETFDCQLLEVKIDVLFVVLWLKNLGHYLICVILILEYYTQIKLNFFPNWLIFGYVEIIFRPKTACQFQNLTTLSIDYQFKNSCLCGYCIV